jgi:hypothetical protein
MTSALLTIAVANVSPFPGLAVVFLALAAMVWTRVPDAKWLAVILVAIAVLCFILAVT